MCIRDRYYLIFYSLFPLDPYKYIETVPAPWEASCQNTTYYPLDSPKAPLRFRSKAPYNKTPLNKPPLVIPFLPPILTNIL